MNRLTPAAVEVKPFSVWSPPLDDPKDPVVVYLRPPEDDQNELRRQIDAARRTLDDADPSGRVVVLLRDPKTLKNRRLKRLLEQADNGVRRVELHVDREGDDG